MYDLRLEVVDGFGRVAVASVSVEVNVPPRPGPFTLSFTDVEIPVSGVPVRLTRAYDNRDKRAGDFGVGWTFDLKSVRAQTNRALGAGWTFTQQFVVFCVVPARSHVVSFTFVDGTVYRFEAIVTNNCTGFQIQPSVTLEFRPLPGTNAQLRAIGSVDVAPGDDGGLNLVDQDSELIDPRQFQLTLEDGSVMQVDTRQGLLSLRDPNGNTLSVLDSGISHSSGVHCRSLATRWGGSRASLIPSGKISATATTRPVIWSV
jgi:hypothetical protein